MRFSFNQARTEQAACRLLYRCGGSLTVLQLVKLLYLTDRAALLRRGEPLTGDRMVSMDYGPVLSTTLNLIKEDPEHTTEGQILEWQHYVSPREGNDLRPVAVEPSDRRAFRAFYDELSPWELELIDEIAATYGSMTAGQLIDMGHNLPEWHAPGGSSVPIDPVEILVSEGRPKTEVDLVAERAYESHFLHFATKAD